MDKREPINGHMTMAVNKLDDLKAAFGVVAEMAVHQISGGTVRCTNCELVIGSQAGLPERFTINIINERTYCDECAKAEIKK